MIVGIVQLSSQDDVAKNLARATELVAECARAGAELVALPENFAFMGEEEKKIGIAEPLKPAGPILTAIAESARKHGVFVIAGGMPEKSEDAKRPYNSSVLVGPDGAVLARYHKAHLFDVDLPDGTSLKESAATSAGDGSLVVTDVRGVPVGMTICYDLRFPEMFRLLGARGARVVTVPAAFTVTTGKDHWHVLLRARAIENQIYIVAPAQHGKHPRGRQTYGKSLIVDPWGDVVAQVSDGEGFATARIDLAHQDRVRAALPCLTHRRM